MLTVPEFLNTAKKYIYRDIHCNEVAIGIHDWSEIVQKQPSKQVNLIAAYNDKDYEKAMRIAEGIKQDMADLIAWTQGKL
jgi:hypothetical protein